MAHSTQLVLEEENKLEKVCVVIPVYKSFDKLNADELISWSQCLKILSDFPICLACPAALNTSGYLAEFKSNRIVHHLEYFPDSAFTSVDGYNQLMLSKQFYQRFANYEYMLTYQLDAFIFRNELVQWCDLGYSYIGAPWFEGFIPQNERAQLWKVGNGGFTLRKIADCLRVLNTFSVLIPWRQMVNEYWEGRLVSMKSYYALLRSLLIGNNTHWRLNDYANYRHRHQEDYFWGVLSNEKFSWFRVPSVVEALQFSFEVEPRRMYQLNNFQLPMGCHAWEKYDRPFWEPFIEAASKAHV
jgi:hypothetical protein